MRRIFCAAALLLTAAGCNSNGTVGLPSSASPASSFPDDNVPISQLLENGYDVKGGYGVQTFAGATQVNSDWVGNTSALRASNVIRYLILQRGASVYVCNNYQQSDLQQYVCGRAKSPEAPDVSTDTSTTVSTDTAETTATDTSPSSAPDTSTTTP